MAMKEWFQRLQPLQLYVMLGLTVLFFIVQLVMSHMTHALTLLVDSYHMLCNIIALVGCIITIKYGSASLECEEDETSKEIVPATPPTTACHFHSSATGCTHHHHSHAGSSEEKRLKNTFGWARIDVLVMLIGCVFLASLCFSVLVEALQTLVHIEHHDEMHHPIPVMCVGASGLLLNGLCYLLIGGYTFHQGSFLHVTPSGDVVLDRALTKECVQKRQHQLSAETPPPRYTQRQGCQDMCRDVLGCVFVMVCSLIVYFTDQNVAKFIDPIFSILSAVLLLILSYPYMKESGSILLQTIPDTINIDSLRSELLKEFPDIVNVHDLHVWRLTATRAFSTAHIIFLNSKDYIRITKDVTEFFHDQGITQVTIQPEFFKMENTSNLLELPDIHENRCLVQCRELGCYGRHCCSHNDQELIKVVVVNDHQNHHHIKNHKKHHVSSRVKDLVIQRKFSTPSNEQLNSASAYQVNINLESSEGNTSVYSSADGCLVHSEKETPPDVNTLTGQTKAENRNLTCLHWGQKTSEKNVDGQRYVESRSPTNLNGEGYMTSSQVNEVLPTSEISASSPMPQYSVSPTMNSESHVRGKSDKVPIDIPKIEKSKSVIADPKSIFASQKVATSETNEIKYESETGDIAS